MKDENIKKLFTLTKNSEIRMKVHKDTHTYRFHENPEKYGFELVVLDNDKACESVYGLECEDMADVIVTLVQDYKDGIIKEVEYVKDISPKQNEVYLSGYFYFKTNASSLEDAMKELESLGFNMDNANEIELRDNDGATLESSLDEQEER